MGDRMEHDSCDEPGSIEAEFATTIKYLDLYLRQKTDLFLQHYVFEPVEGLGQKLMYLTVALTLLAAGTLVVAAGVILLMATVMPLYAALLIAGAVILLAGGVIASVFFRKKIVLQTPTAQEMMNRGNA